MAFENNLMARSTSSLSDGTTAVYWTYGPSATDNLATIKASAYFNEWTNQINKDDYIYLVGTDGQDIQAFTSVQGVVPVTVAAFITAGDIADGSITTAKLADLAVTSAKIAVGNVTALQLGTDAVTTVKIQNDAVTALKILDNTIIQAKLAQASYDATIVKNALDIDPIGAIPVIFRIKTAGGISANIDILMNHKVRVVDVWVNLLGGGSTSDTVTVQNVTTPITDAMDVSGSANAIVRAASITAFDVDASTNLRIAQVDGGGSDSPELEVYVLAMRKS